MLRQLIADHLAGALQAAIEQGQLPQGISVRPLVEKPRDPQHGDYATNLAMTLAKPAKMAPPQIAKILLEHIPTNGLIASASMAGPGFINLSLSLDWLRNNVHAILKEKEAYGRSDAGKGEKVLLEFVSANPTGPLHVGHGRWAAIGSTLANVMNAAGFAVHQEFYINDAGNQMQNLGRSVMYRMEGRPIPEGEAGKEFYGGAYIHDVAAAARDAVGPELAGMDEDAKVKRLTLFARDLLLGQQQKTMSRIRCNFDEFFSETRLHQEGAIQKAVEVLKETGHLYEKDGALWLKSTDFGDDKDRVVIRENGLPTYLAADIAYHWNKLVRGYDKLINIFGADHHGYVARMKAAVQALGYPADKLEIIIGQLVSLYRAGEPVRMSKRTGEMVTLDEVIDEVGPDAARYFLVMRSSDTPLDFDLELAKKETADNPVFYVQYAHARICSILRLAEEQGHSLEGLDSADLSALGHEDERVLMLKLASYTDELSGAAFAREPHRIARFAQDLAGDFHAFYTNCRVLNPEDAALTRARLALAVASRTVLANALEGILGVRAPERM
jgi:arginyl-tRNA synthetase